MPATLVEHNLAYCISKVTAIASKIKNVLFEVWFTNFLKNNLFKTSERIF